MERTGTRKMKLRERLTNRLASRLASRRLRGRASREGLELERRSARKVEVGSEVLGNKFSRVRYEITLVRLFEETLWK